MNRLLPILLATLLTLPTILPLANAAPRPDEEATPSFEPAVSPETLRSRFPGKLEGWAFLGDAHDRVLGRASVKFDWSAQHDELRAVLRLGKNESYAIVAQEEKDAWAKRLDVEIHRYEGQAQPLQNADEPRSFLLDLIPSQEYASGYISDSKTTDRVSFQLFGSAAVAINNLQTLLHPSAPLPQLASMSDLPESTPGFSSPLRGKTTLVPDVDPIALPTSQKRPVLMPPQGQTASPALPLVGTGQTLPIQYPQSAGSGPNPNPRPILSNPEGQSGCTSNCGNQPPEAPSKPFGPTTVPINEPALYETSATDPNGDQVAIVFDWGDETSTPTGYDMSGRPQATTHVWTRAGTFQVTAYAVDTGSGQAGPRSAPLSVEVIDPSSHIPPWVPTTPPTITPPTVTPPVTPPTLTPPTIPPVTIPTPPSGPPSVPTSMPPIPPKIGLGAPPVAILPPDKPAPPVASTRLAVPGQVVSFSAVTTDPNNGTMSDGSVRYQFSWDDDTVSWSPWVTSGRVVTMTHAWTSLGTQRVQVQAASLQSMGNCQQQTGGSPVLTCMSPWSSATTVRIVNTITDTPPSAPAKPLGWDVAAVGATGYFNTSATDPNGEAVQFEFDWGDGSLHTLSGFVPSGSQASVPHTWNTTSLFPFNVRARALDSQGLPGPWSAPASIFIGRQPFEFVVRNLTVDKTTARASNVTDTGYTLNESSPTLVNQGDYVNLRAVLENRGPRDALVDVVWTDDGTTFDARTYFVTAGNAIPITTTEQSAGLFTPGVHELGVNVAKNLPPDVEVRKLNNYRKIDIWVRDPIAGDGGYGALYDGKGPINAAGVQLTTGLYTHARTADLNSFDEFAQGTSTPMRLLAWSPNFTGVEDHTWFFTENIDAHVQAGSGLSFSLPNPTSASVNSTIAELFPLTIGYSERSGSGTVTMGMNYDVHPGSTFTNNATSLQWRVRTNRTPSDQTHAVGFQFTTNAAAAASTNLWRNISFNVAMNYTKVERQGTGALYLWHEIVRSGNAPVKSSVQTGQYASTSSYYPTGDDFNLGDRSMLSLPVWNASASARRTYFDGTTDKSPDSQHQTTKPEDQGERTYSSAYAWFRLDGPIYDSHDIQWIFTAPPACTDPEWCILKSPVYHFQGAVAQGSPEGTYVGWAQFYDEIGFPIDVGAEYIGQWTVTVLIDGQPTTTMTFHYKSTTNDPSHGPYATSDEELNAYTGPATDNVAKNDPSNENLPSLDPVNRAYLEQNRVDGTIDATTERADNTLATYISQYLANQADELLNAERRLVEPIMPEVVTRSVDPVLYETVDELRELPSLQRTTRTVTKAVWDVKDTVMELCDLDLGNVSVSYAPVLLGDATACATRLAQAVTNATSLLDETTTRVFSVANDTLSTLPIDVEHPGSLVESVLADPFSVIQSGQRTIDSTAMNLTSTLEGILPQPPALENLNPKFVSAHLSLVYDTLMQTGSETGEKAVSTADSLFYNLYVADDASRSWTVLNVPFPNASNPAGNLSLVDLNDDGTPDLALAATLAPTSLAPSAVLNASQVSPTLRVTRLTSTAWLKPLLACAYHQLPGVSFVAVTCLDTRSATLAARGIQSFGLPDHSSVTLGGYSFGDQGQNSSATLRVEAGSQDMAARPIVASGTVYQVDLTQRSKPRVPNGEHAEATLFNPGGNGMGQFALRRAQHATTGSTMEWTWTATGVPTLEGAYLLESNGRTLTASSSVHRSPSSLTLKAVRNAADTALDISAQARWNGNSPQNTGTGPVLVSFQDMPDAGTGEAFSLEAINLPPSLLARADDLAGTVSYESQGDPAGMLRIAQTTNRTSCDAPSTPSKLARQGANELGGSCLVLDLPSIDSVTANLALDGPSFAIVGGDFQPLAMLVQLDDDRRMEAYLSKAQSASLATNLAQPQSSASLSWTSTSTTVGIDAEEVWAKAKVGNTLLYWNATDPAPQVQALFDWTKDEVTIKQTRAIPNIRPFPLEFLLTNKGTAPQLPEDDYVFATHDGSSTFAAAAHFSDVTSYRASLGSPNYGVDVTTAALSKTGIPLSIRHAHGPDLAFVLDARPVESQRLGSFSLAATRQAGAHHLDYTSQNGGGDVGWIATFPDNSHVEANLTQAPHGFTLTTTPTAGTLNFDANLEKAGSFVLLHTEKSRDQFLAGDNAVQFGGTAAGVETYRVSLQDVQSFSLAHSKGLLSIDAAQSPAHELSFQDGDHPDFFAANTTRLPASVRLKYDRTGINYTANPGTSPDWDVQSMQNGDVTGFQTRETPAQLQLWWAGSMQAANMTLQHNAPNARLVDFEGVFPAISGVTNAPSDYVHIHAEDAPGSVAVNFNGVSDELTAHAGPTPAGVLEFQQATGTFSIQVPQEPNHVLMRRITQDNLPASYKVLRLENAKGALLRLASPAGQPNQLHIEASSPNGFYAEYSTEDGASLTAKYTNLPTRTDLRYALGTNQGNANATGMQALQQNAGTISVVQLHAEQAGLALDLNASSVPGSWNASWAPGQALDLRASSPMVLHALGYHAAGQGLPAIPGAQDYVLVDASDPNAPLVGGSVGAGVSLVHSDAQTGFEIQHATNARSLDVRHTDTGVTTTLHSAQPANNVRLAWTLPTNAGQTSLDYEANGPTSDLAWGLDAPTAKWRWTATELPNDVTVQLDPAAGTLVASAPGGAGALFKLQYTSDPAQPYFGTQPGLVLLSKPTGPENYPANVTTFTLDMPHLTQASATFTGTNAESFGASFARSASAIPTELVVTLANGAELFDLATNGVARSFGTSWATDPTGFHGHVETDAILQGTQASLRGKDGLGTVQVASIGTGLTLDLAAIEDAAGDAQATLDYSNGAASSLVNVSLNAAGVLANLSLENAPRELHVHAPLKCGSVGGMGRAWVPNGENAGQAHLVLAPVNAPNPPLVPEEQRVVATCDGDAATIHLDAPGFQEATWATDRVLGATSMSLQTATPNALPVRLVLRGSAREALDATSLTLPAELSVEGVTAAIGAQLSVGASTILAKVNVTYTMGPSSVNATLLDAPTSWSLTADATAATSLVYAASSSATHVLAEASMPVFGAHVEADDAPGIMTWTMPTTTCPPPTQNVEASFSTLGSGSVGTLVFWTLPGQLAEYVDQTQGEHTIFACDDHGPRSLVKLMGAEEIRWARTVVPITGGQASATPLPPVLAPEIPAMGASLQVPTLPLVVPAPLPTLDSDELTESAMPIPLGPLAALGVLGPIVPVAPLPAPYALPSPGTIAPVPAAPSRAPSLPVSPSLPMTASATSVGPSGLTNWTMITTRDVAKIDTTQNVVKRFDDYNGDSVNSTGLAPVGSTSESLIAGPQNFGVQITRDAISTGAFFMAYAHADSVENVWFFGAPTSAKITFDGTGDDFLIDYTASGVGDGIYVDTNAAGPSILLDARDGIPPRLFGSVRGPTASASAANVPDCSGTNAPTGASLRTEGGSVGMLRFRFADVGVAPPLSSQTGAMYTCLDGRTRALTTILTDLEVMEMVSDSCSGNIVAEADSFHPSKYAIRTSAFDASLTAIMAPTTVAVINATLGHGAFGVRTQGTNGLDANAVIADLEVTYNKKGELPAQGAGASCLTFGSGLVRNLELESTNLNTNLQGQIGQDYAGRSMIDFHGLGAQSANLNLQVDPSPSQATGSGSETARLNITADFPISGSLNVTYSQTGSNPPQVLGEDASGNYAYIGTDGLGAKVQVLGFHDASLVLDRTPAPGNTWDTQTIGQFAYNLTTQAPLSVIVFTGDQSGARVKLDEMPTRVQASMTLLERPGNYTGNLAFSSSDPTPLKLQFVENTRVAANLTATLPQTISGNFGFGSDDVGDPQGWLSYTASDSIPEIRFIGTDAGGNVTHVFLNGVPWQFEGTFTGTSCGFGLLTQTPDNSQIDSIWYNLAPNATVGESSSKHTTPGCPTSKKTDAGEDEGTTSVDVMARGVPGGKLNAIVSMGKAGRAIVDSDTGPIGSIAVTATTIGGDSPSTLTLSAKNVMLKSGEWDFDGDTRYGGKPSYLFLDTGGVFVEDLALSYHGTGGCSNDAIGVDVEPGNPIALHEFQVRMSTIGFGEKCQGPLGVFHGNIGVPLPKIDTVGVACYSSPPSPVEPLFVRFGGDGAAPIIGTLALNFAIFSTPGGC